METRTTLLYDPLFLEHRPPSTGSRGDDHPERPERLEAILTRLEASGWLARLDCESPPAASAENLAAVHTPAHLDRIRRFAEEDGGGFLDPDTYAGKESYRAALHAAGAMTRGVDLVLDGQAERAFSLARPPGHHATRDRPMGFCLFNSIAAAAVHARRRGVQRVLIVDWDVHHGNGTQEIFYLKSDVLYFSVHQWPHWPGTGRMSETGVGEGVGATTNVPLPPGIGDAGYRQVFEQILVPLARRFAPELVLISAGYDAHAADPLSSMQLSTAGFGALTRITAELADELCDGRIVAGLEGGYHLEALADSVLETLRVLAGEPASAAGDGAIGGNGAGGTDDATNAAATVVAVAKEVNNL